jgi:predicted metal-dependent hydrolase
MSNPTMQLDLLPASDAGSSISHHRYPLHGRWIDYVVKRSRRRGGITLTIDERGLRVGAPWRASPQRIESLIRTHAEWISRKLNEWQARTPPPVIWQAGAAIRVMGEPRILAPVSGTSGTDDEYLYITVQRDDPRELRARTIDWLRATALNWFEHRAAHYAPLLGVRVPQIGLSNARTRWGVCHPDGRIRLVWRLIQMPATLIDYVVVHELAHLRVANHSDQFWRWVANVLPDHKSRRETLRKEGHLYLIA